MNRPEDLAIAVAFMNGLTDRLRQACLLYLINATLTLTRDMDFQLSDFLRALAKHVQDESDAEGTRVTRATVSSLLEAAAAEAETRGRELP